MTHTATISDAQRPLNDEMLELLRSVKSWEVIPRPATPTKFPARILAARSALKQLEVNLASPTGASLATETRCSALFELRASSNLLRSAINAMPDAPRVLDCLPRVVLPNQEDEPRVAAVAALYLRAVDGNFSPRSWHAFIRALQDQEPLTLDELEIVAAFLQFALLESLLDEAIPLLRSPATASRPLISTRIKSLLLISRTDWSRLMEPLILFDATLRQDPARSYESMDFDSRELYRKRVAFIARHSNCSESEVAKAALELAQEAAQIQSDDPRIRRRRMHIGYYLIEKGFPQLALRTGFHPPLIERVRTFMRAHADDFYISGIVLVTLLFTAGFVFLLLSRLTLPECLIAALLLVLPVMQCAVDLVNSSVIAIFDPESLPKLDFSRGIPDECTTMAVVPTLLLNEEQVRSLVNDLEVRFLANRDSNLHFALLTDLPDSVSKPADNDSGPLVELAVESHWRTQCQIRLLEKRRLHSPSSPPRL